ncbi:MAG: hypothetical protein QOI61_2470 [Actinomycetota bacterium]|jgi:hypothetical protein
MGRVRGNTVPQFGACTAVAVTLFCLALVVGLGAEKPYDPATKSAVTARIQLADQRMLRHANSNWGYDIFSYYARAEHPLGSGYLERRTPYVHRFLYPMVTAFVARTTGLPILTVMVWLSALALAAVGVSAALLSAAFGLNPRNAAIVGLAAGLTPGLAKLLESPAYTDLFGAALASLSLIAALRHRQLLSLALLVAAIWTRETNLLFAAPLVGIALVQSSARWAAVVFAVAAAAYQLPHFLFSASAHYPVMWSIHQGLLARRTIGGWTDYVLFGLSIMVPLSLLGIAKLAWRRDPLGVGLALWLAGYLILGFCSADSARLVGSAAPLVVVIGSAVAPENPRRVLLALSIVGGLVYLFASGAAVVLALGLCFGITIAFAVIRRGTPDYLTLAPR